MTDDELKKLIVELTNLEPPKDDIPNLPSGPPEFTHAYRVGFLNGWAAYRQAAKKKANPPKNT